MQDLEKAITKTLCYAAVFDYPLTPSEVHHYLIESKASKKQIVKLATDMTRRGRIIAEKGLLCLPSHKRFIALRLKRQTASAKKFQRAQLVVKHLSTLPQILGVFLTGATAMDNADYQDDIDLLIVTRAQRIWMTRLFVALTLQLLGLRRTTQMKQVRDKVCVNMYLDELALAVPVDKRNLYTAHEVVQAKPLINRENIHERFLLANQWVQGFLPNTVFPKDISNNLYSPTKSKHSFFDQLAFQGQYRYMKPKITREVITPHMAYFHPQDTGSRVLQKYQKLLRRFLPA